MKVARTIKLDADPSKVWAFVGDFYNFAAWQPHIAAVEPTEVEGERLVHMKRGNTVRDRIVERDDAARSMSYTMIPDQNPPPGAPKIEDMLATLQVRADGAGSAVEYAISVTVPEEVRPMAEKGIGDDIAQAMASLQARFPNR